MAEVGDRMSAKLHQKWLDFTSSSDKHPTMDQLDKFIQKTLAALPLDDSDRHPQTCKYDFSLASAPRRARVNVARPEPQRSSIARIASTHSSCVQISELGTWPEGRTSSITTGCVIIASPRIT